MIRFEEGKIYKDTHGSGAMIRISKRSGKCVWFEFLKQDGGSYSSATVGISYKKVQEATFQLVPSEYFVLDIGLCGEAYYASEEISEDIYKESVCEFHEKCKRREAEAQRQVEARALRTTEQAQELLDWCDARGVKPSEMLELLSKFSAFKGDVLVRVEELIKEREDAEDSKPQLIPIPCPYRKGYDDCAMETTYGRCPYSIGNGKCGCVGNRGGSNV